MANEKLTERMTLRITEEEKRGLERIARERSGKRRELKPSHIVRELIERELDDDDDDEGES